MFSVFVLLEYTDSKRMSTSNFHILNFAGRDSFAGCIDAESDADGKRDNRYGDDCDGGHGVFLSFLILLEYTDSKRMSTIICTINEFV